MNAALKVLIAILCFFPLVALADYPDPERMQAQVELFTRELVGEPGSVVVTGSSSIRRWRTIQDDLAPAAIIPTGIPGSNMNDLDYHLHDLVLRFSPKAVVIYQGDNDTAMGRVSIEQIIAKFDTVMMRIKAALPDASVYVMSVKPSILRWANWPKAIEVNRQLIERADERDDLTYVDVATPLLGDDDKPRPDLFDGDGVHLNSKGYRLWTSILQPILAAQP